MIQTATTPAFPLRPLPKMNPNSSGYANACYNTGDQNQHFVYVHLALLCCVVVDHDLNIILALVAVKGIFDYFLCSRPRIQFRTKSKTLGHQIQNLRSRNLVPRFCYCRSWGMVPTGAQNLASLMDLGRTGCLHRQGSLLASHSSSAVNEIIQS